MSALDIAGLIGVGMILVAYAGAQIRRMDPTHVPSLLLNLVGSLMILASLARHFNVSAFAMEATWGLVAVYGLGRRWWEKQRAG